MICKQCGNSSESRRCMNCGKLMLDDTGSTNLEDLLASRKFQRRLLATDPKKMHFDSEGITMESKSSSRIPMPPSWYK